MPGCAKCPLRGIKVGNRGNEAAPWVIVGEGPGNVEQRKGIPFVGPSGEVLWRTLPEEMEEDVYCTNAACCRLPKTKNENVTLVHNVIKACRERLVSEITAHPRKIITALGNVAAWSLTGDYDIRITRDRGKLIKSPYADIGIILAVHPAALLRGTGSYRQFRNDIAYSKDLVSGVPERKPIVPTYKVCTEEKDIKDAVEELLTAEYLAGDIETTGLNKTSDVIIDVGVCSRPEEVTIFPGETLLKYPHYFKQLFATAGPRWIWHNGKFDISFLRREDYDFHATVHEDTMLLSYALDETSGIHDLEQVAGDLLSAPDYKNIIKKWMPKKTDTFAAVPKEVLYERRLAPDVSLTMQVFHILRRRVRADEKLEKLYTKTLIPASELLHHVEKRGLLVDTKQVEEVKQIFLGDPNDPDDIGEIGRAKEKLIKIAGYEFNPNSPPQVAKLLFDDLGLRRVRGRSTKKEVLDKLSGIPVITALKEYRQKNKRLTTYITGKRQGIENAIQADGRVHTTFKLHGTSTGRLSSNQPNVQNIPRNPAMRSMFVAPAGYRYIEFDLNQAELRSLAALSGDVWLRELYHSNTRSLHTEMSAHLFGKKYTANTDPEEKHEYKMKAKMVNFGIVYGRTGSSIAEQFDLPTSEGDAMINAWFKRCPQAHKFIMRCRSVPARGKTIFTTFGRKKRHNLVTKENLWTLQNEAANFPHQSIASDITLQAAIELQPILEKMGVFIVNLVHDSILVECPDNPILVAKVKKLALEVMESIAPKWGIHSVPFKADWKEGHAWGHLEEPEEPAA